MNTTRLWIYKMMTLLMPESRMFGLKVALLRWAGAEIGENVRIYSSATFYGTGALAIGDDVHIGSGVFMSAVEPAEIRIGNCCDIAPQVMILTGTHEVNIKDDPDDPLCGHIAGKGRARSVLIGDGCWLGARTVVLPGVTLARKTLTAAGAVVTKSEETGVALLAGVPARVVKTDGRGRFGTLRRVGSQPVT